MAAKDLSGYSDEELRDILERRKQVSDNATIRARTRDGDEIEGPLSALGGIIPWVRATFIEGAAAPDDDEGAGEEPPSKDKPVTKFGRRVG